MYYMDVAKLVEAYVAGQSHLKSLQERQEALKKLLVTAVDTSGDVDDKGHRWLAAGDYLLQRQRRQGDRFLPDVDAEDWAKSIGIWDLVHRTVEELDKDELAGWVFDHKDDVLPDGRTVQEAYDDLWVLPDESYAFLQPQKVKTYEY